MSVGVGGWVGVGVWVHVGVGVGVGVWVCVCARMPAGTVYKELWGVATLMTSWLTCGVHVVLWTFNLRLSLPTQRPQDCAAG